MGPRASPKRRKLLRSPAEHYCLQRAGQAWNVERDRAEEGQCTHEEADRLAVARAGLAGGAGGRSVWLRTGRG